jgi:hypothetical protein
MADKMPMMAMTTNSSINVKARRRFIVIWTTPFEIRFTPLASPFYNVHRTPKTDINLLPLRTGAKNWGKELGQPVLPTCSLLKQLPKNVTNYLKIFAEGVLLAIPGGRNGLIAGWRAPLEL